MNEEINESEEPEILSVPTGSFGYNLMSKMKGHGEMKEHRFVKPSEETMKRWKDKVRNLIEKNLAQTKQQEIAMTLNGNAEDKLSMNHLIMYSIGEFITQNIYAHPDRGKYAGNGEAIRKILNNGEVIKLDDFDLELDTEIDTCIHGPMIMKLIAEKYGIEGEVEGGYNVYWPGQFPPKWGWHYIWKETVDPNKAESALVMDPSIFSHRQGYVGTPKDYSKMIWKRDWHQAKEWFKGTKKSISGMCSRTNAEVKEASESSEDPEDPEDQN